MLMMKSAIEDTATEGLGVEHAGDEGLEFDVAVVQWWRDRAGKLDLVGLEIVLFSLAFFASAGCFGARQSTDHGAEMAAPGTGTNGPKPTAVVANAGGPKELHADEQGA